MGGELVSGSYVAHASAVVEVAAQHLRGTTQGHELQMTKEEEKKRRKRNRGVYMGLKVWALELKQWGLYHFFFFWESGLLHQSCYLT